MINQKAPRDMTAPEFVAHLKEIALKECKGNIGNGWAITISGLEAELVEPAPNPFTEDQLAWMRVEQRNGYHYATIDRDGAIWNWEEKPERKDLVWRPNRNGLKRYAHMRFLQRVLSWGDPEPLCFADYAPLPKGADHADD